MTQRGDLKKFLTELRQMNAEILSVDFRSAVGILISKILLSVLPLLILWVIKNLVDQIGNSSMDRFEFLSWIVVFCIIQISILFLQNFSNHLESVLQTKTLDYYSNRIMEKSASIDYAYFEDPKFQNTLYLAQHQARFRINQLLPAIYGSFGSGLSLIFLIGFFFSIQAYFFLVIVLLAIPITLQKWYEGKKLSDLEFKLSAKERESNYLFQSLTGLQSAKEVRLYDFAQSFQKKYNQIRSYIRNEKNSIQKNATRKNIGIGILEIIFAGAVFTYLGSTVLNGVLSIGMFVLYLQGTQRLQSASKSFFQSLLQLFQLRTFIKDLQQFLALKNLDADPNSLSLRNIESITVEGLNFQYPGNNLPVLENIHLKSEKGKIIALVGENGSGKSTLVKLIAGLYPSPVGAIKINETDLSTLPKKTWHNQLAVLFQDFEKYFIEVDKNIHFELSDSSEFRKDAIDAATKSMAHDFIVNLSKQYDTRLGNLYEGSEQLSGGQWQKLALARIFFKDRPIVILDEPSSALDAFAELALYENIKQNFKEKIVILVSHRLYNLKIADKIYVLSHGRIVEEGSFESLIHKNGLFQSMYEKQKI